MNEATSSVEFALPNLPIAGEDQVRVAFSVNGQQFVDHDTPAAGAADADTVVTSSDLVDVQGGSGGGLSFRYKAPPHPESLGAEVV